MHMDLSPLRSFFLLSVHHIPVHQNVCFLHNHTHKFVRRIAKKHASKHFSHFVLAIFSWRVLITVNSSSVVLLKVSVLTCQPIKSLSYIQHAIFHSFPPPNQHSHLIPCHCTASLVKMSLKQNIYIYYILPLRCSFWILSPKLLSVFFFFACSQTFFVSKKTKQSNPKQLVLWSASKPL